MSWLKQSTAQTVKMGPFVDSTDGVTPETALTISQADIRLSKNGGDFAQSNNAAGATHDENGYFDVPLDATDTNTLGRLKVAINESGALPVWKDFMVLPANVWDSLFGADKLQVDAVEWLGGTIATPTVTGVPEVDVTHVGGSAQAITTNLDATVSSRASQASVDIIDDFLDTEIAAILADTNELQTDWANGGRLDNILDARASQASVDVIDGNVDTIGGIVTAILADTGTDGVVVAAASKSGYLLAAGGSAALTEGYPADGAAGTIAELLYLILANLQEKTIAGTAVTLKKLDGTTTAASLTLDDATTPTSVTRSG